MADALTPPQWRDKLRAELLKRAPDIDLLHRYYDGKHPLPTAPDVRNESYRRLAHLAQINLAGLVVDAVSERLEVSGLVLSDDEPDGEVDDELEGGRAGGIDVWRKVWQENDLDGWAPTIHDEALIAKRAFALVWPDGDDGVTITPELPTEVVVAYKPGTRRERVAALKEFVEDGRRYTVLFLPDEVHYWQAPERSTRWSPWPDGAGLDPDLEGETWATIGDAAVIDNPFAGAIPVVEFLAKPDVSGKPRGELTEGVRRIQDRVNKTLLDRLVAAEFVAYPQRYALGLDPDDAEGKPRKLVSGPERTWIFEGSPDEVKIDQLEAGELKPYLDAIAADIEAMAAITKTPVYYLASTFANVGADTIVAVDAGLVKKIRAHQRIFGEAWEQVIRLALRALDDPRADDAALEVKWADPEVRTRAELGDWAIKVKDIIPLEDVWQGLGASPQDIERMTRAVAAKVVEQAGMGATPAVDPVVLATLAQKLYLAVPSILTPDEARTIMRAAGADLDQFEPPAAA